MKPNKYAVLLLIFILALFFRTYRLADVPYGFHVDEVKAGWNAYSILSSGKDDKGNIMPLYYDSFGDFRPTGLMYLIIPFLIAFGKSVLTVRLPFALIGAATTFPMFYLVAEIGGEKKKLLPYISAFLLALNPWHIIVSRSTSESVVALFLAVFGLYFFIKLYRESNYFNFGLSLMCLLSSYFFYHNIRVLAPIFLLVIVFIYKYIYKIKIKMRQLFVLCVVLMATLLVFVSPQARGRLSQVGLKSDFQVLYEVTKMPTEEGPGHVIQARAFHNRIVAYTRRFIEEYREYFSIDFLVGNAAKPIRYSVPQIGLLGYIELICVIAGMFYVSKNKEMILILGLLMVAPIPAAITIEDTPNLQRALFLLPFLNILASFGLYEIVRLKVQGKLLFVLLSTLGAANFIYFWHMYTVHQPMSIATYYRNGGNVELVDKIISVNQDYSKVVITNYPDELLPWFEFLSKDRFDNVFFTKDKCPSKKVMEQKLMPEQSVLYVDAEGCNYDLNQFPGYKINDLEVVKRPDNSPPYILRTVSRNEAFSGRL